jgi:periplasmic protein TonB
VNNDYLRLAACVVGAAILHVALANGLSYLPARHDPPVVHKLALAVVEPPRVEPPPPPPEPEPPKPPPKPEVKPQVVREAPRATHPIQSEQPKDVPPPDHPPPPGPTSDEPTFGVTMESTSQGGTGPAINVGNTTRPQPAHGATAPTNVKPLAEPVAAYEATKMPLPQGNCSGKYNAEALAAGIEGTVVIDLVIGEDGRTRDVQVVQGIGHGLDQAAIAALQACRFTPGERDGQPVAVKVKGFKIRFVLPEHD